MAKHHLRTKRAEPRRLHLFLTGGPNDPLALHFDGGGLQPIVTLFTPDQMTELRGVDEICAIASAMQRAVRRAKAFVPPDPAILGSAP